jgi:hypothetical protein
MSGSIRHRILLKIKEAYQAVQPPDTDAPGYVPSDADWPFAFSTVEIGPLSDEDQRKRYSIGIVAGPECESYLFPLIECQFTVNIEFRATVNQGDPKPGIVGEQVLTVVKRVIDVDRTWGGLARDTLRIGNEIDLVTYGDKTVMGVLQINVFFRHSHADPRKTGPDA